MEILYGKGFLNSLPWLLSELWILILLLPDVVSCLLEKCLIYYIHSLCWYFPLSECFIYLKSPCPHLLPGAPSHLPSNSLHDLSSFGGPSTWLRPRSPLMWLPSFLCYWNFFSTWSLLIFVLSIFVVCVVCLVLFGVILSWFLKDLSPSLTQILEGSRGLFSSFSSLCLFR